MRTHLVLIRALCAAIVSVAGTVTALAEDALTPEDRAAVVRDLAAAIRSGYVLESKGAEIATALLTSLQEGRFDSATTVDELAASLTLELRASSNDLHLRVSRTGQDRANASAVGGGGGGAGCQGPRREGPQAELGGTYSHRMLPGNVGVLEVAVLGRPLEEMEESLKALAGADGIIVDLRDCPGGMREAIDNLASVVFDRPELLVTLNIRGEEPQRVFTLEEPPGGVRFTGKLVFLLTSGRTGSGCEELAYDLKYHEKAILVGETTAGAGNGSTRGLTDIGHGLEAFIPNFRAEHPRHAQGFEGVGVAPDVSVSAGSALDQAHLLALSRIRDATTDLARRRELERVMLDAAAGSAEQTLRNVAAERRSRELEGSFGGGMRLAAREGGLRLENAQRGLSLSLEEEGMDTYAVIGTPGQKLRLVRDASGAVTAIEVSSPGGGSWRRSDRVAEN